MGAQPSIDRPKDKCVAVWAGGSGSVIDLSRLAGLYEVWLTSGSPYDAYRCISPSDLATLLPTLCVPTPLAGVWARALQEAGLPELLTGKEPTDKGIAMTHQPPHDGTCAAGTCRTMPDRFCRVCRRWYCQFHAHHANHAEQLVTPPTPRDFSGNAHGR